MWKVYYSGGSTFSDMDGAPNEASAGHVQVVVRDDRSAGWSTQTGSDFYVWDTRGKRTTWWGVDHFGLWSYLTTPGWKRVLFGEAIDDDAYDAIMKKAMETHPRTSKGRRER